MSRNDRRIHDRTSWQLGIVLALLCAVLGLAASAYFRRSAVVVDTPADKTAEAEIPQAAPETRTAKLFMAGDGLVHGSIWMNAETADGSYDFTPMLENLRPILSQYDLKYYNQETILGGTELGLHGYPRFNSPQEFGDATVGLGFNLVSTANNHSLDKDEEGILRSTAYWKKQTGVVMAGTYASQEDRDAMEVHEINGISYVLLSYTYGCNGLEPPAGKDYLVNIYSGHEDELLARIKEAKQKADVVIVAMHWGTEYSMEANDEQRSLAKQMADAGAGIIIGCHPHVIEPVEWIGDTICYYSLGNMISAQDQQARLIGMIGGVTITKTIDASGASSVKISDAKADLIYTYYRTGFYDFKVYPFWELDDSILPGWQDIYQQYCKTITEYDDSIQVGMQ